MHIAIIGNGNVGSALQRGLKDIGIDAPTTGKDPEQVHDLGSKHDTLFLAVPWTEHENVLKELGDVQGKLLIDVSNPLNEKMEFADPRPSAAQLLQQRAKGAHVVKAFNTVFAKHMGSGELDGQPLTLFVAGDDDQSKDAVKDLGGRLGYDPVDAGPLANARWLETLGFLNINLGYAQEMGQDIGFRLIHPSATTGARQPRAEAPRASR